MGDQYNSFLDFEEVNRERPALGNGDVIINREGKLMRPKRLPCNLYQFRDGHRRGSLRARLHHLAATTVPTCCGSRPRSRISSRSRRWSTASARSIPNAKLVYNNSPSFNWTLNFRLQVLRCAGGSAARTSRHYDRAELMSVEYDDTPSWRSRLTSASAPSSADAAKRARDLPPPDHAADLPHGRAFHRQPRRRSTSATQGMLGYVKGVQRQEIRQGSHA